MTHSMRLIGRGIGKNLVSFFTPFGPIFGSLTIYIELEGRMRPQNDTLDEADRSSYRVIFYDSGGTGIMSLRPTRARP